MGRVLVTGLNSFTGPYVERALDAAGHEVVGTESLEGFDLRVAEHANEVVRASAPDFVVHLAAVSFVGHSDASEFYAVNAVGTTQLLQAIHIHAPAIKKVLLASSANVYGNTGGDAPIAEGTPPAPVNHYACSKLSMEFMARTWFERLPILIARPFNYTGVGQREDFLIPKLVKHYATRSPRIELGNTDIERDFSDVRSVAEAYASLLATPARGETVNICSGRSRSLRSILAELEGLTGHRPELAVNEALVRSTDVHRLTGCNKKLCSLIGEHHAIAFSETLRWMVGAHGAPQPV